MPYFETQSLCVGYQGKILIHDISISLEQGEILTLIGPNGAGKSTILKTITRQLAPIAGCAVLSGTDVRKWAHKSFAQTAAVMLTDRIRPELMSCAQVVAMGRYPYTNLFGKLTPEDEKQVEAALQKVHARDLAQQDFATLSDGQRQRVLLARAICQQPQILILDEPTAYLDIHHKIELLEILRTMAREEHITVIMSLHEIDLAMKVSDRLLCVKGDTIAAFGPPEQVLHNHGVEQLYDLESGSYDLLFGSVELAKPTGEPQVFVVAGDGYGVGCYRALQKQNIPFATGILFENDVDYRVARELSDHVVSAPAFSPMTDEQLTAALALLHRCKRVMDAGTPIGTLNEKNQLLLDKAEELGLPVEKEELPWKP